MFKLTLIKSDQSKRFDITPIVGDISWDADFSVMAVLEFDIAFSDARFFPKNPCDLGDVLILTKGDKEVFRGILVDEDRTGRGPITYKVYDYSWYLFESTTVYQFNDIAASKAIEQILNEFGIKIGSIPNMPTKIKKIYMKDSPAKIIRDILDKVESHEGYTVNVEMREGKIYFEKRTDLLIEGKFKLAANLSERNAVDAISEPKRSRTIKDMRNRIRLIVEGEENDYEITAQAENTQLINKYGLLEETLDIDAEDAAKSRQVAKILLARLGKVHEKNEVRLMGDIKFKAGRLFDLTEPVTGISGRFMISSVKHKVSQQIHTMDIELVLPEDVV